MIFKNINFFLFCVFFLKFNFGFDNLNLSIYLDNNSGLFLGSNSTVYCKNNIFIKEKAKVYNKGNLKINGDFINKSPNGSKNFIINYDSDSNYGQIIIKDKKKVEGQVTIEYPGPSKFSGGYIFSALPFNNNYSPKYNLSNDLSHYDNFVYNPKKYISALKESTLLKFKIVENILRIPQWEAVPDNSKHFDSTLPYAFKVKSNFSLSGTPSIGPYNIHYNGIGGFLNLRNYFTDYKDDKFINKQQPVMKIIGGDYFSNFKSSDLGKRFFAFANPSMSNIDFNKIKYFFENIDGIAIAKKEVKNSNNYIAYIDSYHICSFIDGIPTGDLDALYAKPRDVIYVKVKKSSNNMIIRKHGFSITDEYRTFNKSSYKKNNDSLYDKLCLKFCGKKAYIFVKDNVVDGKFIQGEARQPYQVNRNQSSIYTLQNKDIIDKEDYNIPLHTNVISKNWVNKPIKLIVNNICDNNNKDIDNNRIEIVNEEGCNSEFFSIVKDKQNNIPGNLKDNKYINLYKKGWNFFYIYYNNPNNKITRKKKSCSFISSNNNYSDHLYDKKNNDLQAFWCDNGVICFNNIKTHMNDKIDIKIFLEDGNLYKEDLINVIHFYRLPSIPGIYYIKYKLESEKDYKFLQAAVNILN